MPRTLTAIEHVGYRTWRYTWAASTPPYRVVYRGLVIATTAMTSYDYVGGDDFEPAALEIIDATETSAASQLYPPYAAIQFRGYTWASHYVVAQKVSGSWVDVETIHEAGLGYYSYVSQALPDTVVSEFRVTAYDRAGNASDPVYLNAAAICHPDPPSVSLTVLNGTLTVSAR